MDWEWWIINSQNEIKYSRYDFLCELAISSYKLDKKSRKSELKDTVQFFLLWWEKNKKKMNRYNTYTSIGILMKIDHSTVLHHLRNRKPTAMYTENTRCINDFLNS
jgi:hypothetical protein